MNVDDRVGLAAHGVNQEDKLSRTFGVPVHASGQNVSQVWRAGPLEVWLEEREDGTWVAVQANLYPMLRWGEAVGLDERGILEWMRAAGGLRGVFKLTPALDRFLVELVDVIADVRRAAGTVQLELEGLEEGGGE